MSRSMRPIAEADPQLAEDLRRIETGERLTEIVKAEYARAAFERAPKEEDIRRCHHDYDPCDKVCGECGCQLWSKEDYDGIDG